MERVYEERINWEDFPSTESPINAPNLNKMDYALYEIDKRVADMHERLGGDVDALPIEKGGTGAKTALEAQYRLLKDMKIDSSATVLGDNTRMVGMNPIPTQTSGALYYFHISEIWTYIKSKISSLLGLTSTNYNGTSAKATADADGNVFTDTYLKQTDTLSVENGGTGGTTAKEAQYNLLGNMNTVTSAMDDNTLIAGVYLNPSGTNGTIHKRKASLFWDYISGKIKDVLGLTATQYAGIAQLAAKDVKGNVIDETYATKNEVAPINNLLATVPGSPLDAVQGRTLDTRITTLEEKESAGMSTTGWTKLGSQAGNAAAPIMFSSLSKEPNEILLVVDMKDSSVSKLGKWSMILPYEILTTSTEYIGDSTIMPSSSSPTTSMTNTYIVVAINSSWVRLPLVKTTSGDDCTTYSTLTVYYR